MVFCDGRALFFLDLSCSAPLLRLSLSYFFPSTDCAFTISTYGLRSCLVFHETMRRFCIPFPFCSPPLCTISSLWQAHRTVLHFCIVFPSRVPLTSNYTNHDRLIESRGTFESFTIVGSQPFPNQLIIPIS